MTVSTSGRSAREGDDEDGPQIGRDSRDFAAVYDANRHKLRVYAASVLRGAGLANQAEDAVQDAVMALWKRFQLSGTPPADWFAAMMNKVRFCALDMVKAAGVRPVSGFSLDEDDSTFQVAAPGDFTADHASTGLPRAALAALEDPQQREVLYLLFYEDKTQAQIAKELGLTPGRITQIKQAALLAVAACIDGT